MLTLTLAFMLCLGVSLYMDPDTTVEISSKTFIAAGIASLSGAGLLFWIGRTCNRKFFRKEALAVIGMGWVLASIVGAIPYFLITPDIGLSGALFESASGLTTTGASVLSELEKLPPSLLFWRSLSQWIGGMGVVVFFVAILGFIGVGAKILYANEASGAVSEFEESRVQSTVARLIYVYFGLSVACAIAYRLAGMNWFDSVNHTFATLSTGGFSTRSTSLAAYASPLIEWVSIVFMTLGGISFLLIISIMSGRFKRVKRSTELIAYLLIILFAVALTTMTLLQDGTASNANDAIRASTFQVVSILTTTGFATEDFAQWSALPQMILLALMAIGGCSGSTAGGLKVSRVVIAIKVSLLSIERSFRSRIVRQIRMNNRTIGQGAITDVTNYLVLAGGVVIASLIIVSIFEPSLRIDTNLSAVTACFFNIGPGLAEVGPAENFAFLHPYTKLYLSLLMIMGRLEVYAVIVLFAPSFWRRFS